MANPRLNKRQLRRIDNNIARRRGQAEGEHGGGGQSEDGQEAEQGLVIAHQGGRVLVEDGAGAVFACQTRRHIGPVVCGDRVVWERGAAVVTAVRPRRSALARPGFTRQAKPIAANISLLCIVIAPRPRPREALLDRYLVVAETLKIKPLIVCAKMDLLRPTEARQWRERFRIYADLGYCLVAASSARAGGVADLRRRLRGEASILVGQSGVGKSSMIAALMPRASAQEAPKVGALSTARERGRHTTSEARLFHLPDGGGSVIDSPGVVKFSLAHLPAADIEAGFVELRPWLGRCRYASCAHAQEPGCALREAAAAGQITHQRLDSFLALRGDGEGAAGE